MLYTSHYFKFINVCTLHRKLRTAYFIHVFNIVECSHVINAFLILRQLLWTVALRTSGGLSAY
jgi:hypothetical protein